MTSNIIPKIDEKLIEDIATAVISGKDIASVAPLYGFSNEELSLAVDAHECAITKQIAEMESDGRDIRIKSRAGLAEAIHQVSDAVRNGQMTPGQLTRVIEILHKTSGLEAELRREEPDTGARFSLVINLGDRKIVYGDAAKEANVLDGEAIDVTPAENRDE